MKEHPSTHWSDEALLGLLYGIEDDRRHPLDSCPECRARWNELEARRHDVIARGDVSEDFLRAQRQAIYHRIEQQGRTGRLWWRIPVGASAMLAALVLLLYRQPSPTPPQEPPVVVSDAQFFTEIAAEASGPEARAAEPIRGLFAETE